LVQVELLDKGIEFLYQKIVIGGQGGVFLGLGAITKLCPQLMQTAQSMLNLPMDAGEASFTGTQYRPI
jgi:hypothetical protein